MIPALKRRAQLRGKAGLGRILVTGGAGYIGTVVTELLYQRGYEPIVLDNLSQGYRDAVAVGVDLVEADLQDRAALERLFAQYPIEAVIHLAAVSVVSESVAQPLRYYRENVGGLLNLLDAMHKAGVNRIVFSSTAAVYGMPEKNPITEESPTRAINPYGWTKLIGERILADAREGSGVNYVSLRYFNVAGATELCGEAHQPETHLIPRVLEVALRNQPHMEIYGTDYETPDGTCIRDYIHVVDLAEAHILALDYAARRSGIFNLGNTRGFSVREVLACAEKVTRRSIPYVESSRRAGDPPELVASHERIQKELGWAANRGLEEMIASAWAWRQRRPQ